MGTGADDRQTLFLSAVIFVFLPKMGRVWHASVLPLSLFVDDPDTETIIIFNESDGI